MRRKIFSLTDIALQRSLKAQKTMDTLPHAPDAAVSLKTFSRRACGKSRRVFKERDVFRVK